MRLMSNSIIAAIRSCCGAGRVCEATSARSRWADFFESRDWRLSICGSSAARAGSIRARSHNPRIQKPGLALAGYLPYVKEGRVQILGESEYSYLETLGDDVATDRLSGIVDLEVPCLISTKGQQPPAPVIDGCNQREVPVLTTMAQTSETIEIISGFLEDELAPRIQMHGVSARCVLARDPDCRRCRHR